MWKTILSWFQKRSAEAVAIAEAPIESPKTNLADGRPVPEDGSYTKLRPGGQQYGYIVLAESERAKGFVRPVRRSYRHIGPPVPKILRDLTQEQKVRYEDQGYAKYEEYEVPRGLVVGKFWTQADIDRLGKGCCCITTMGDALAETYAREPNFYNGTFCCTCGKHFPVGEKGEFVWEGTDERVGT